MAICKQCKDNKAAKWRKNNPDKWKSLKLKRKYGITTNQYNQILELQNGVCAICGNLETTIKNNQSQKICSLAVDHDHKTGKVRGLLCSNCNKAIGFLKENIDSFYSAIKYLLLNK